MLGLGACDVCDGEDAASESSLVASVVLTIHAV